MCDACLAKGLNRRKLMLAGMGGVAAAASFGTGVSAQPVSAVGDPDAALKLLVEGNARYVANQGRASAIFRRSA